MKREFLAADQQLRIAREKWVDRQIRAATIAGELE